MLIHISEILSQQLELALFPGEPWEGHSSRALTRAHLGFILNPRGGKSVSAIFDHLQFDLFPRRRQRNNQQGRMAPTLLPLPHMEDR